MRFCQSEKDFHASPALIPGIADAIARFFEIENFEVQVVKLDTGEVDISVANDDIVKLVKGVKSALKVVILPQEDCVTIKVGVGVFEQQAIQSALAWMNNWSIVSFMIWSYVRQSELDERAFFVAEKYIEEHVET